MASQIQTEILIDRDQLSRCLHQLPENVESFATWLTRYDFSPNYSMSVYWRKYAETDRSVHIRGCKLSRLRRDRGQFGSYQGFINFFVDQAKKIEVDDYTFMVEHAPNEECQDIAHARLRIIHKKSGFPTSRINKNTYRELVDGLKQLILSSEFKPSTY